MLERLEIVRIFMVEQSKIWLSMKIVVGFVDV